MLKFYRYSISTKRIFENMPNYEIRKQILLYPNKNRTKIRYDIQGAISLVEPGPLVQEKMLSCQTGFSFKFNFYDLGIQFHVKSNLFFHKRI